MVLKIYILSEIYILKNLKANNKKDLYPFNIKIKFL